MGFFGGTSKRTTVNQDNSLNMQNGGVGASASGANSTVNIQQTDLGAIESANEFASNGLADLTNAATDMTSAAVDAVQQTSEDALFYNNQAIDSGVSLAGDALNESFDFGKTALDVADNTFKDGFAFGKDSLNFAGDSISKTMSALESGYGQQMNFAGDALNAVTGNSKDLINFADKQTSLVASTANGAVSTVKNLAENLKAGVSTQLTTDNKTLLYIVGFVVVVGLVMMFKGRK